MKKKLLAIIMSAMVATSMMPVLAFADAEETVESQDTTTVEAEEPAAVEETQNTQDTVVDTEETQVPIGPETTKEVKEETKVKEPAAEKQAVAEGVSLGGKVVKSGTSGKFPGASAGTYSLSGSTLTLSGVKYSGKTSAINSTKSLTIVLKGSSSFKTTGQEVKGIKVQGTDLMASNLSLTIKGSGNLSIATSGEDCGGIQVAGSLKMQGTGTLKATAHLSKYAMYMSENGIDTRGAVTISSGTVIAEASGYAMYGINTGGGFTVTKGKVKAVGVPAAIAVGDKTNIKGGTVTAKATAAEGKSIQSADDINISGGTVTGKGTLCCVTSDGLLSITGGNVNVSAKTNALYAIKGVKFGTGVKITKPAGAQIKTIKDASGEVVKALCKKGTSTPVTSFASVKQVKKGMNFTLSKANASTIKVQWKGISGAAGYQIANNHAKNGKWGIKYTTGKNSRYYFSIGKSKGKTYKFKMRYFKISKGKRVYSPWSSEKSFKM